MQMETVDSSNVHSIGYDPETQTLAVQFHSGHTSEYPDTTPEQHAAFMAAPSKGQHFHRHIRRPKA